MTITKFKWPRQYAHEIVRIKTRGDRRLALEAVPAELQPLVKKHVELIYERGVMRE